jgi:hypothetical protein
MIATMIATMIAAVGTLVPAALVLAEAQGEPEATHGNPCATSYERAQEQRTDGRLRQAQAELRVCVQESCPAFIRSDCQVWQEEVEAALPTVVLRARRDGKESAEVSVRVGGQILQERLDGQPVPVDPGSYAFTFAAPGAASVTVRAVIAAGQKDRIIAADLPSLADALDVAPATPPPSWWAQHREPAVLGAVGVAGLAGFAVLGSSGLRQERALAATCQPRCEPRAIQEVRDRYHLADVSLGASAIAFGVAGYLLWRQPDGDEPRVSWTVGPRGALVLVGSRY